MILKNTILSTERVAIRIAEPHMAVAPAGGVVHPYAALEPGPIAHGGAVIPEPPAEEPLEFEDVAHWLSGQDEPMRARLATLLADEMAALRAAALAEGAEQGRNEAMARVKKDMATAVATLESLAQAAEAAFAREQQQLADQCTAIVAEAIARIAGPALTSREATLGLVTTMLARLKDEREIVVRVSEGDLPLLQGELPALRAAASGHAVSLVADRRVTLGGCIVDTRLGSLDGRLETQLAGLFETLRALRATGEGAP